MNEQTKDEVRATVREQYGNIARSTTGASCCAPGSCGPGANASLALGYSAEDLAAVPEGANMGLGCGNPQAIAALKSGETMRAASFPPGESAEPSRSASAIRSTASRAST
jgi:hypothetical protein